MPTNFEINIAWVKMEVGRRLSTIAGVTVKSADEIYNPATTPYIVYSVRRHERSASRHGDIDHRMIDIIVQILTSTVVETSIYANDDIAQQVIDKFSTPIAYTQPDGTEILVVVREGRMMNPSTPTVVHEMTSPLRLTSIEFRALVGEL